MESPRDRLKRIADLVDGVLVEVDRIGDRIHGMPFSSSQRRDLIFLLNYLEGVFPKNGKTTRQAVVETISGLPHLFGYPWYGWAREFFEAHNREGMFLTAANQISKSSTQIRKNIHWATAPYLWKKLWMKKPSQFWYLYPNKDTATVEFDTKWLPEFLPRGKFKEHPIFGWDENRVNKQIHSVRFKIGPSIYFKTYMQQPKSLQAGTCDAIFGDEEIPDFLYDELMARISATDGYFHSVFTATLNQDFWRLVMEAKGEHEKMPKASKWQISKWACQEYEDGQKTMWTKERIERDISRCKNQAEVARRIEGKFVTEAGRKYYAFEWERHMVAPKEYPVGESWNIFCGVDIGSGMARLSRTGGNQGGHPSAIVFIGVSHDFREGIVFLGWRGDGVETTAKDVLEKYEEMVRMLPYKKVPIQKFYDWHSKDFSIISQRAGHNFDRAEKGIDTGENILNTLFQNGMLHVWETEELRKLGGELGNLMKSSVKTKALDDFSDALRYAVTRIPWDFSHMTKVSQVERDKAREEKRALDAPPVTAAEWEDYHNAMRRQSSRRERREYEEDFKQKSWPEMEEEFDYWNDLYDGKGV